MSKAVLQFIEIAREHHARIKHEHLHRQYCEQCNAITNHASQEQGDWEQLTCKLCGRVQIYRVR